MPPFKIPLGAIGIKNHDKEVSFPAMDISLLTKTLEKGAHNILFVCTGNICRSPVAEYLLRHEMSRLHISNIAVGSAGLLDLGGRPADPVMISIGKHRQGSFCGYDGPSVAPDFSGKGWRCRHRFCHGDPAKGGIDQIDAGIWRKNLPFQPFRL